MIDAVLSQPGWTAKLLSVIEDGRIPFGEITAAQRQRLLSLSDSSLHARAAKLSTARLARKEILLAYNGVLSSQGNRERGEAVFQRVCASCHRVAGKGHAIGPDLEALTDTTREALMIAVLDPNREVDARYLNYAVSLTDGRVMTGMIASETGNAITLKRQDDQSDTILRSQIDDLKNTGVSLMPEGLERDVSPADLSDVVAYLQSPSPPKSIAGNRPEIVTPANDGSITLRASNASIFGDSLTFEPEFGNLGYWHSLNDRAIWTFRVDRPGTYSVAMEWACDDSCAGNKLQMRWDELLDRRTVGGTELVGQLS